MRMLKFTRRVWYVLSALLFGAFFWQLPGSRLFALPGPLAPAMLWIVGFIGITAYELYLSQHLRQSIILGISWWIGALLAYYVTQTLVSLAHRPRTVEPRTLFALMFTEFVQWSLVALAGGFILGLGTGVSYAGMYSLFGGNDLVKMRMKRIVVLTLPPILLTGLALGVLHTDLWMWMHTEAGVSRILTKYFNR